MYDNDDKTNDDGLAPMVDGLSGALCVLILITTVFMISASDTVLSGFTGYSFQFTPSKVNLDEKKVIFNGGVRISLQQLFKVRQDIAKEENPTLYLYIPEVVVNRDQKMVYNFNELKKMIVIDKPLTLKTGDPEICGALTSCIYWGR